MLVGTAMTGRSTRRDHARQCPLHAGHGHDHIGLGEGVVVSEQTVEAGDAAVVQALDAIPESLGNQRGFLGDGMSAVPADTTAMRPIPSLGVGPRR